MISFANDILINRHCFGLVWLMLSDGGVGAFSKMIGHPNHCGRRAGFWACFLASI